MTAALFAFSDRILKSRPEHSRRASFLDFAPLIVEFLRPLVRPLYSSASRPIPPAGFLFLCLVSCPVIAPVKILRLAPTSPALLPCQTFVSPQPALVSSPSLHPVVSTILLLNVFPSLLRPGTFHPSLLLEFPAFRVLRRRQRENGWCRSSLVSRHVGCLLSCCAHLFVHHCHAFTAA